MKRSREESQDCTNRFVEEDPLPPLNLILTKTPELISLMEPSIKQDFTETLTPQETRKNTEKPKAMNFPISKITIGQWTRTALYPDDLKAKFYFAKKKLMWEFLDNVETETGIAKLKRKIEIQWSDVLSFKPAFHSHDDTGILQIELSKRPRFFIETNSKARRQTLWKQTDQDFTRDQFASKCRRHTLHFAPGVLQKNLEKLLSSDSFWSELIKVNFPSLEDPFFDNSDHYFQGFGHVGVGEVDFNVANQYCVNDGRQMSSFVQDSLRNNIANQLQWTQVMQPSSQPINEHSDIGIRFNNPMIQDESQMRNTGELLGSRAYGEALLETQTNSMHMNDDFSVYTEIGPYLESVLAQEGEAQNMEHTQLDGNFQIDMVSFNQFDNFDYYDQYFGNNNGLMPPDL